MADFDIDAFDSEVDSGSSAEAGDGGLDVDEETENTYRDAPNVQFRPTIVVDAEAIERFDFDGRIDHERNLYKSSDDERGDQFILGLKGAEVQYGEAWEATNGHSADYKVLNTEASDVELDKLDESDLPSAVDIEDMDEDELVNGVTVAQNQFKSERSDLPEHISLWQGGRAGEFLARFLDVIGGGSAYYNGDDDAANALFEYPPDDREGVDLRVARTPTLRGDMIGQPVRLYYKFSGSAHQVHVERIPEVGAPEDAGETLDPIYADDEDRHGEPEYNSYVYWDDNMGNGDGSAEESESPATSEDPAVHDDEDSDEDNPFADAEPSTNGHSDEYDPSTYADLKEPDKAYVGDMVSMWEDSPVSDVDDIREAITFEETYEEHVADDEDDYPTGEVDVDTMATIINEEA